MKKILALIFANLLLTNSTAFAGTGIMCEKRFDHVLELPICTELDYDFIDKIAIEALDLWGGGCTAVATVTEEGETLVGRNMDLNISHKPAFIIRTNVKDCYETLGLAYLFNDFMPDYDTVLAEGLTPEQYKLLPFLCTDVMNTEGLYVETNMRNGEAWPTGDGKFICSGTNPDSEIRVFVAALPRFIAERCATVEEALSYVETLDIYTQTEPTSWNFCFMMADATGRYGLLEIACNRVVWHEGQRAQANFYIDEEFASIEELCAGLGRYDVVTAGVDEVKNADDMFQLIDRASYFQMYTPETCKYDYRSEFVGTNPWWTTDFVLDEANKDQIDAEITRISREISAMTREERADRNVYWESTFTEVANCTERTLFVRFFENDEYTLTLAFD